MPKCSYRKNETKDSRYYAFCNGKGEKWLSETHEERKYRSPLLIFCSISMKNKIFMDCNKREIAQYFFRMLGFKEVYLLHLVTAIVLFYLLGVKSRQN